MYPTRLEIEKLHKKYAASTVAFDTVFNHCQIVLEIVQQLLQRKSQKIDEHLVTAGALLHDIGAYQLVDADGRFDEKNYIKHGVYGSEILRKEKFPEELCRIAERHTGVGLTVQDIKRQRLDLPYQDFLAETVEERLIMYADKFHSKTPRFNSFLSYSLYVSKFGIKKVFQFKKLADEFGKPDLKPLAEKYHQKIV